MAKTGLKTGIQNHLETLFSKKSFESNFSRYEERPQQKELAQTVLESFKKKSVCLIEAGTGTGKSLGYLIPAILWALETGERVVISTHTIPLQEQLIQKEIPLIQTLLDEEIQAELAKGMSNYLCAMKLHGATMESSFLQNESEEILYTLNTWALRQEHPVTKSMLPIHIPNETWKNIQAENESCTGARCRYFSSCHFFRARKALIDKQIIIVNHHLLLHDLLQRAENDNWEGTAVLPQYSRVIIDEAHHLEEVALSLFQTKIRRFDHLHIIRKLSKDPSHNQEKKSPLFDLIQLIHGDSKIFQPSIKLEILHHLEIEIAMEASQLEKSSENLFDALLSFARDETTTSASNERLSYRREGTCRVTEELQQKPLFEKIVSRFEEHKRVSNHLDISLQNLFDRLKESGISLNNTPVSDKNRTSQSQTNYLEAIKGVLHDIKNAKEKLSFHIAGLNLFFSSIQNSEKVVWIEWAETKIGGIDIACITAAFDVGQELKKHLFDPLSSSILLSATLTTKNDFTFTKERLGISLFEKNNPNSVIEAIYPSPFPYHETTLLALANNISSFETQAHAQELDAAIFSIVEKINGGTLVLFTSYGALENSYSHLSSKIRATGLQLMKQGEKSRTQLLQDFRLLKNGVLFATDSFWEGVDIPGDSLRCVIITKLPFDVPSDPMYQARHEAMEKKGLSSFMHYGLPRAVVKFKQAFGRLIRSSTDYGAVVCLDARICNKSYGTAFISSVPKCQIWKGKWQELANIVAIKIASHKK